MRGAIRCNQTQSDAIKMQSRSVGRYLMRGAISNQWWQLEVLGATQRQSEANTTRLQPNAIKTPSSCDQDAIKAQSRRRQDAITMQSRTRRATRRERGSIVSRRGDKDHAVLIHSTLAHLREAAGVVQVGILAKRKVDDVYACPKARTGEWHSRKKGMQQGVLLSASRPSAALSGPQRSSAALSGPQRPSALISAHIR